MKRTLRCLPRYLETSDAEVEMYAAHPQDKQAQERIAEETRSQALKE